LSRVFLLNQLLYPLNQFFVFSLALVPGIFSTPFRK
jgi:hypothetical protein